MVLCYKIKYTKLYKPERVQIKEMKEIITRKPGANNFDERNDTYKPNANESTERKRGEEERKKRGSS